MDKSTIKTQAELRRTFAIISHPDAGKTTLTEKLLLYSGMLQTAGMVRARKTDKGASSDWMEMEQERGISITASAMQFEYKGVVINVLDTPGHQDFSEDTYRTLTAADSAVMVIDAAKGVEPQTRKLFTVCSMRGIPILTFINKMDLPTQDPYDLVAELEEALGIQASPIYWPIGSGKSFRGVANCLTNEVILFEGGDRGKHKVEMNRMPLEEAVASGLLEDELLEKLQDDLELLKEAGNPFDMQQFLAGKLTPVFFGSALTNFGVEPFFDSFSELAPCPRPRPIDLDDGTEKTRDPIEDPFSAYVFKIQANMDPRHRDSMAYLRVCSGVFERDLTVKHHRSGKELRLSRSHSMFGGSRNTLDSAFPGDIVGVVNPGAFAIGDTVSSDDGFNFKPLPSFPPEVVARIRPKDVMRKKAFDKGMKQFREEGAVLILTPYDNPEGEPLVAAVGILQFEVLQHRMKTEYKVDVVMENLPYGFGAWLDGDPDTFETPSNSILAVDPRGRAIFLYAQDWQKNFALEKNPDHGLNQFVQ